MAATPPEGGLMCQALDFGVHFFVIENSGLSCAGSESYDKIIGRFESYSF